MHGPFSHNCRTFVPLAPGFEARVGVGIEQNWVFVVENLSWGCV